MKTSTKIIIMTILLTLIGLLMVYSSSAIWAEYKYDNKYYYFFRQLLFSIIGIILMFVVQKMDYHLLFKYTNIIFFLCIGILICVLIPGVGIARNGARSWIGIGSFSVQTSEFAKLGLVIFLAKYLSRYHEDTLKLKYLFVLLLIVILFFGLIMLQPDFGTGIVLLLSAIVLIFVSGIKRRYICLGLIIGIISAVALIIIAPYRIERISAFINPYADPLGSGFQAIQSLYALVPGGFFGVGLFNSRQKFYYLPEPQTDFIYSIIVEELGLLGGVIIVIIFVLLVYYGIDVAIKQKDLFGQFLAIGITMIIFIQVFVNIGVVIGLLPVTGITLPFISYGGSSLTLNLINIGILVNISKEVNDEIYY